MPENVMNALTLYWSQGCWRYDDAEHNRRGEPFVLGASEAIDALRALEGFPKKRKPFQVLFSACQFPGAHEAVLVEEEAGGSWYRFKDVHEGWLCPALFDFFDQAPASLWVKPIQPSRPRDTQAR
jgi:hypothetical protein